MSRSLLRSSIAFFACSAIFAASLVLVALSAGSAWADNAATTASSAEPTSAELAPAEKPASIVKPEPPAKNGWEASGSKVYYYQDGVRATGFTTIKGKKYLFDAKGNQLLGWQKVDGGYYFFSASGKSKGYMRTSKVINGVRLGKSGKAVLNTSTLAELKVLCKAQQFVEKYAPAGQSRAKRLEKCWKRLIKGGFYHYYIARNLTNFTDQHRAFANDILDNRKGDCNSTTSLFAYLANALGYKKVMMCSAGFHSWTDINGKIYDVHWTKYHVKTIGVSYSVARARGGTGGYYAGYSYTSAVSYTLAPHSTELMGGKVSVKKVANRGWRENGSVYYLSNGKKAKGVRVIKGKLYKFTSKGKLDVLATNAIQKASKYGAKASKLLKLLGTPKKVETVESCYAEGAKDLIYTYDHVVVSAVKMPDGSAPTLLGFSKR